MSHTVVPSHLITLYPYHADPFYVSQTRVERDERGRLCWSGRHFRLPNSSHVLRALPAGQFEPALGHGHLTHEISVVLVVESTQESILLYRTQRNFNIPGTRSGNVCAQIVLALIQAIGESKSLKLLTEPDSRRGANHPWGNLIHNEYRSTLLRQLKALKITPSVYLALPDLFNLLYQV